MNTPYHAPESAAKLRAALADAPGPAKALDAMIADTSCQRQGGPDAESTSGETGAEGWLYRGTWLSRDELPYWSGDLAAAAGWLQERYPGWAWRLRNGRFRPGRAARPFATFHDPETGDAVIGPPCHTEILALLAGGLTIESRPLLLARTAGLYALDNPDEGQTLYDPAHRMLVSGYLRLDAQGGATASLRRRHGDGSLDDETRQGRCRILSEGLLTMHWSDGLRESFLRDGGHAEQSQLLTRNGTDTTEPQFERLVRFRRISEG
ncbi:MAG: hypothetical protein RLO22_02685 [Sneathiellaceae bacterium]